MLEVNKCTSCSWRNWQVLKKIREFKGGKKVKARAGKTPIANITKQSRTDLNRKDRLLKIDNWLYNSPLLLPIFTSSISLTYNVEYIKETNNNITVGEMLTFSASARQISRIHQCFSWYHPPYQFRPLLGPCFQLSCFLKDACTSKYPQRLLPRLRWPTIVKQCNMRLVFSANKDDIIECKLMSYDLNIACTCW